MSLRHHCADHLRTCTVACPFLLTSVSLRFSLFLSESLCEVCQVAFPRCVDDIAGEVAYVLDNETLISHLRCAIGFLQCIHSLAVWPVAHSLLASSCLRSALWFNNCRSQSLVLLSVLFASSWWDSMGDASWRVGGSAPFPIKLCLRAFLNGALMNVQRTHECSHQVKHMASRSTDAVC